MAGRFAATMRRQIFKQHLGLIPPQDCPGPITPAMRAVGVPNEYAFHTPEDVAVQDPLSDDFLSRWTTTARTNAEVYQNLFHCVPAKGITSWAEYNQFVPPGEPIGHIHNQDNLSLDYIKGELAKIHGFVTEMPLDFLEKEELSKLSASVNSLTLPICEWLVSNGAAVWSTAD